MSTPETTVSYDFEAAPALQEVHEKILARFPKGKIKIKTDSETGETFVDGKNKEYKDAAQKMLVEAELAYTNNDLTPHGLKTIIKTHLPDSLKQDNKTGETFNGKASAADIKVGEELTAKQKGYLKDALKYFDDKDNVSAAYDEQENHVSISAKMPNVFRALNDTIDQIIRTVRDNEGLSRNEVRTLFKGEYEDHTSDKRQKSSRARNLARKVRVTTHQSETVTEIEGQELISLALEVTEGRSKKAFTGAFQSLCGDVEVTTLKDDTPAFKIHSPVYTNSKDEEKNSKARQHIRHALKYLAEEYGKGMLQRISAKDIEDAIKATAAKEAVHPDPKAEKAKALYHVKVPLRTLNTKPTSDFAGYLVDGKRTTALGAFAERSDLAFGVSVKTDSNGYNYFELNFDTRTSEMSVSQITLAELLLTKLRQKWEEGRKIDKAMVSGFLEDALWDIKHNYSKQELGDGISIIFAALAGKDHLSLAAPTAPANVDEKEGDTEVALPKTRTEVSLMEATSYQSRGFHNTVSFSLSPWEEDEEGLFFTHKNGAGDTQKFYPTDNQAAFVNALRDPDIKVILLQAPTGAGKTFWSTRIALEILQHGGINKLTYERPLVTVGDHYNPYLKGGMEEKFGIFSDVLEKEIAKHLGQGDVDGGYDVLQALKKTGKIQRYDQMYKRGDTIEYEILLGDEMQNKDRVEIFHLMSRPGKGAKVILIGDAEYQTDLTARGSGFMQAYEIFSNAQYASEVTKRLRKHGVDIDPKTVTTLRFGAEDIKRDAHTAFVYEMYKYADELAAEMRAKQDNSPENGGKPREARQNPRSRYHQHKHEP